MTKAAHVLVIDYLLVLSLLHTSKTQDEEATAEAVTGTSYDKTIPPNGTAIYVQLEITFIGDVRDYSLDFPLHAWVTLLWQDSRLHVNVLKNMGLDIVPLFVLRKLWTPSISFDSVKDAKDFSRDVYLRPDGYLMMARRSAFLVHCSRGSRMFVFDVRTCEFVIATFHADEGNVGLMWLDEYNGSLPSIVHNPTIQPLVYELVRVDANKWDSENVPGSRRGLSATFHFSKRPLAVLLHTYIPSTMVVFASWVSFWIEVSMITSRFTLGIVCLLVLSFQGTHNKIGNPGGTNIRAADVWLFMSTVLVFLSLVECAVASNIYREHETTSGKESAQDIRYGYRLHRTPSKGCIVLCDAGTQTEGSHVTFGSEEIDELARMVFPIAFFFCCCFYALWFATTED
ncbi:glycine receptor subunit alpha-2-like [Ornithodoros turicata]|uniref:glycine receptor subunit alpha-2-like n=1 Tax=Ornithodoros turicata TaxID=34597 RepID=UPI003139924A